MSTRRSVSTRRSTFRLEKSSFNLENDVASEDFDLPRHSGASSSWHSVASIVPTLLNTTSSFSSTTKLVADHEIVASDEESASSEKRDRDSNVVQTLKDGQNFHNIFERRKSSQKKISEPEADMEVRNWEKRKSDISLYEINQELESHRLQLQQANQWADRVEHWK